MTEIQIDWLWLIDNPPNSSTLTNPNKPCPSNDTENEISEGLFWWEIEFPVLNSTSVIQDLERLARNQSFLKHFRWLHSQKGHSSWRNELCETLPLATVKEHWDELKGVVHSGFVLRNSSVRGNWTQIKRWKKSRRTRPHRTPSNCELVFIKISFQKKSFI